MQPAKIVSGGQSGADRAGLEAAKALGIKTGGVAPKGWRVCNPEGEDDSDPSLADFGLIEHESREYPPRTKLNAQNSDGTVWFGYVQGSKGATVTLRSAKEADKPVIVNPSATQLVLWVKRHKIKTLNVAGNRASSHNPSIFQDTYDTIIAAFTHDS